MTINRKIQKTDVVKAALQILKHEDPEALTARRLATVLDCSVQPIFYNFANMEELRTEVFKTIHSLYVEYMSEGAKAPRPYKGMGLAYIKFARDYPRYFRLLFMSETDLTPETFLSQDETTHDLIRYGRELTGFNEEQQRVFHLKVWIFTHGLASLVASGTVQFNDADIERLLTETTREMVVGFRKHLNQEEEL